jgi:hypothetical protein
MRWGADINICCGGNVVRIADNVVVIADWVVIHMSRLPDSCGCITRRDAH